MRDIKFIYKGDQLLTGKLPVTSVTSSTLTSTGASWESNEFMSQVVKIVTGSGSDTVGRIISNNATTLTVQAWNGTQPEVDDEFVIANPKYLNKNKFYYAFKNEIVQGREKLIQDIIKSLLTQAGSNLYNVNEGNDFMKQIFKRSYSTQNPQELQTTLEFSLNNIKQNIINRQTSLVLNGEDLNDSETLVDIIINKLEYNTESFFWDTELLVETKAGTTILGI